MSTGTTIVLRRNLAYLASTVRIEVALIRLALVSTEDQEEATSREVNQWVVKEIKRILWIRLDDSWSCPGLRTIQVVPLVVPVVTMPEISLGVSSEPSAWAKLEEDLGL